MVVDNATISKSLSNFVEYCHSYGANCEWEWEEKSFITPILDVMYRGRANYPSEWRAFRTFIALHLFGVILFGPLPAATDKRTARRRRPREGGAGGHLSRSRPCPPPLSSVRASDRPPRNGAAVSWRGPPELGRLYDFSEEAALKNPSIVSLSALEEDSDGVRRRRLFDIVPLLPHSNDASRPSSRASPSVQPSFELGGDERSLSLSANLLLHPYLGPSYLPLLPLPLTSLPSLPLFPPSLYFGPRLLHLKVIGKQTSLPLSLPPLQAGGRALSRWV